MRNSVCGVLDHANLISCSHAWNMFEGVAMSDKKKQPVESAPVADNVPQARPKKTRVVWKCSVCGYVETRYPEGLPASYRCPICNANPKKFKRLEVGA